MAKTAKIRSVVHPYFGSVSISSKTDKGFAEWDIVLSENALPLENINRSSGGIQKENRKIIL